MARGNAAEEGAESTAANGYHYIKLDGKWRLKHHIIAETSLGRSIDTKTERVIFIDGDRHNLDPDNIKVVAKGIKSNATKIARIRSRIADLQAELEILENS